MDTQDRAGAPSESKPLWYYAGEDGKLGPISPAQLRVLAHSGGITPETMVWKTGLKSWVPARKIKGLFADVKVGAREGNPFSDAPRSANVRASTTRAAHDADTVDPLSDGMAVRFLPDAPSQEPSSSEQLWGGSRSEVFFEGRFTPDIAMLPGERVLDTFEAGLWDLGLFGWMFHYKRRLVLTTHRLFRFDKRIIDNMLEIVWLRSVKSIAVGQSVSGTALVFGGLISIGAALRMLGSLVGVVFGQRELLMSAIGFFASIIMLAIGVAIIVLSRRKVMLVNTGVDTFGMKLVRIESSESKRFADKIFGALAALAEDRRPS